MIVREDHGTKVLASVPFKPEFGKNYAVEFKVEGDKLTLTVDGKQLVSAQDGQFKYGMAGLRIASAGRMSIGKFEIVEG